jgi:hypothetical protein
MRLMLFNRNYAKNVQLVNDVVVVSPDKMYMCMCVCIVDSHKLSFACKKDEAKIHTHSQTHGNSVSCSIDNTVLRKTTDVVRSPDTIERTTYPIIVLLQRLL